MLDCLCAWQAKQVKTEKSFEFVWHVLHPDEDHLPWCFPEKIGK